VASNQHLEKVASNATLQLVSAQYSTAICMT
jgi:hypothetical protein